MRLNALEPRKAWVDAADKGAKYLVNVRDSGLTDEELPPDHWLLYALNELYRARQEPLYLKQAQRIATSMISKQNRSGVPAQDWIGSYTVPPRSTPAATRLEGLCSTYKLFLENGLKTEAHELVEAMRLGTAYQLRTQFKPESALYLKNPRRALGGFHSSFSNYSVRIDFVQHNISALLCLKSLGEGVFASFE